MDERLGQPLGDVGGGAAARAAATTGSASAGRTGRPRPRRCGDRARRRSRRPAARRRPAGPAPAPTHRATSASSYWRSTLKARTTAGRAPAVQRDLEAADPEGRARPAPAGRAARTRAGSISTPTTRTSGRTRRSRSCSSTAVTGDAPYPRSTTTGVPVRRRRSRQACGPGQPAVDPAQPVGVGRAAGDGADRPLRCHAGRVWGPRLPPAPPPGRPVGRACIGWLRDRRQRDISRSVVPRVVAGRRGGTGSEPLAAGLFDRDSRLVDVAPACSRSPRRRAGSSPSATA